MNIKLIKTESDYDQALVRLEKIFDAKLGSKEGDELEVLAFLIEKYELRFKKRPINLNDEKHFGIQNYTEV